MKKLAIGLILFAALMGCTNLTPGEKQFLRALGNAMKEEAQREHERDLIRMQTTPTFSNQEKEEETTIIIVPTR